jgi:hypothetical protein
MRPAREGVAGMTDVRTYSEMDGRDQQASDHAAVFDLTV